MKAWTVSEFDNVVSTLKPLIGSRLQEVQTSDADLVLGFYTSKGVLWLWIDLNALSPCLLPWTQLPLLLALRKSPLNLFLRAHFRDRVLRSVERVESEGRVILMKFGKEGDHLQLELRLFPHARNVLAQTADKKIAWQKPKDLPESGGERVSLQSRSLEELREEWLAFRGGKGKSKGVKSTKDVKTRLENELEKKKKALIKVQDELAAKRDTPWKSVGAWLKQNQNLNVPREWEPFVDKRRKLSWNIEQCFTKAREIEGKLFGTEKRLEILKNEIAKLEDRLSKPITTTAFERAPNKPILDGATQGRTLKLSDELTLISGKSAADNLKLLRKARAWDWWFHLRDSPSSHAILFRNKNAVVSDQAVQQVLEWYVRQHLGAKFKQHAGEKFEILIAECRHVKPIKGDRLGRVTYHFERVVTYRIPSS